MTAIRMTHHRATGFPAWRRRRPLVGGLLLVLSGIEMFFSGQLDLGNIHIQMGFSGFQATVIPLLLAVLGVLIVITPAQRMFYGVFALILAVYSLVGVNLGGFLIGMLLGAVGGVITVAWRPTTSTTSDPSAAGTAEAAAVAEPESASELSSRRRDHGGVVHAEAVDYATLKARAEERKRAGASTPAEPRPFARRRSS